MLRRSGTEPCAGRASGGAGYFFDSVWVAISLGLLDLLLGLVCLAAESHAFATHAASSVVMAWAHARADRNRFEHRDLPRPPVLNQVHRFG
jgi:hypothetical protein